MTAAKAYIILGAAGSGRYEILADLLSGVPASGRVTVCVPAAERNRADATALGSGESHVWATWTWDDGEIDTEVPEGTTHFFFVTEGLRNPVDQIEALSHWLPENGVEPARILTVVHCRLAQENPGLDKWYDACIHFSDYVLLNRREGVSEKWIRGFRERYGKAFYPCIFEPVKKGRIKNPALVLDPLPRRLSHLFDGDTEGEPEEAVAETTDPYLVRLPSGKRDREIPDIGDYAGSGQSV